MINFLIILIIFNFIKKMEQIQPYLFMMMSSKNDSDSLLQYLPILIVTTTFISKIIPFNEIKDNIMKFFNRSKYILINIPSHEVPVMRGFSNTTNTKLVYSKNFLSIIHHITVNKISNLDSLTEVMSKNTELNIKYDDESKSNNENEFIFIPIQNNKILIDKENEIFCELLNIDNKNSDDDTDDKKKNNYSIKNKKFIIKLFIKKIDDGMDILKNFIDNCNKNYDLFINRHKKDNDIFIYEYKNSDKYDSSIDLKFDEYVMTHNKDLNINIFFEGKEKLINYINPFIFNKNELTNEGEEKYKRSGFTFKAGLLFYGSPGCGKTSTIKAILKHTNRHGIIINLSRVNTCEELQLIFRRRKFNNTLLEGKQLCYILEDCDAFDNNVIKNRKNQNEDNEVSNEVTNEELNELLQFKKLMNFSNQNESKIKQNDNINLSCFLNILDGIIELHGIMIIMTTNHPEKIDTALIRPGRFDFKYEFKKASKNIIKEMLKFKFMVSDEEINLLTDHLDIKDEVLSPAEIQSICFKNDNISECINEILELMK